MNPPDGPHHKNHRLGKSSARSRWLRVFSFVEVALDVVDACQANSSRSAPLVTVLGGAVSIQVIECRCASAALGRMNGRSSLGDSDPLFKRSVYRKTRGRPLLIVTSRRMGGRRPSGSSQVCQDPVPRIGSGDRGVQKGLSFLDRRRAVVLLPRTVAQRRLVRCHAKNSRPVPPYLPADGASCPPSVARSSPWQGLRQPRVPSPSSRP